MTSDTHRPNVDVVALLASAGGLDALSTVLRDLPIDFPAAIVVQQHLGGHTSVLPAILNRSTQQRGSWAMDGQMLAPGQVIVCPPGVDMELMPDGTCRLRTLEGIGTRRFDVLLASMARSYAGRGLAVVLSGSGHDGAEGTAAMARAGAIVIAQTPNTAAYPSMPIAAAKAGAALVLPIGEIGRALTDIIAGVPWDPVDDEVGSSRAPPERPGELGASERPLRSAEGKSANNSAGARAQAAGLRAAELRRRRQDLAAGGGATEQTVAAARRRAEESLRRYESDHPTTSE
jgi:two-component system chemotaxis response regulator CheB